VTEKMNDIVDAAGNPLPDGAEMFTQADPPISPEIPVKRRPGRPRKDGTPPGSPRGEPVNLFQTGEGPKPKGRPPAKKNIEPIKRLLVSVHLKVALISGVAEIAIDDEEATMLAESGAALLDYYKIKVDGKRGALIAFVYAVMMVYGPRAFGYAMSMRNAQPDKDDARGDLSPEAPA
jgi:hypothetical protein